MGLGGLMGLGFFSNPNYVYDYMFHLLNEYAKLLKFEPKIPEGDMELRSETWACSANGTEKKFMRSP